MPYSLFKEVANSTQIVIKANGVDKIKSIRDIKKVILFKEKLKQNKIKYQNITKKIFDLFEANPNLMEIAHEKERNKKLIAMLDKDMELYRASGFSKEIKKGEIVSWTNHPVGTINGKLVEIKITYSKYFKNPNDFDLKNKLDPKNIYHKEVLEMIKEYDDIGIALYMNNNKSSAANLLELDQEKSYFRIKKKPNSPDFEIDDPDNPGTKKKQSQIESKFNGSDSYDLGHGPEFYFERLGVKGSSYNLTPDATVQYKEIFLNPVPYVINTIASIVADTIRERNEIAISEVTRNRNLEKYESAMNSYQIINYLNVIEHWNQLWSRLIGEEPFWYDPLDGKFNFENQMNYLLSYEDFPLQLNAKKCIDINKVEYFQQWLYVLIAYLSLSVVFLISSIIVINRKDIT